MTTRTRSSSNRRLPIIGRKRRRIETVNAWFKTHGLARLTLRGRAKAKIAGLLQALAHNLMLAHHYRTKQA